MSKPNIEALSARLDMQSVALQEVCRALNPTQSKQVATALQARASQLPPLHGAADASAAGELAALLSALRSISSAP
jgi:hypothetical protein